MDRFLENNTVLRIIALVLAVALWLGVHAPNNGTTAAGTSVGISQSFPKDIQVAAPSNMVVTSVKPAKGSVVVREDPQDVASLPAEMLGVSLVADAQGLAAGTHQVRVAAVNMPSLPARSYSLSPAVITVTLAPKTTKSVAVAVHVTGSPEKSYTVGKPSTDVTAVQVSGAEKAVARVSKVVATVPVGGMNRTVTHVATLIPEDENGHKVTGVSLSPDTTTVTVPIDAPAVTAALDPQIVGMPAAGYAVAGVTVNPTTVQISGDLANDSSPLTVALPIDVTGFQSSRTLTVQVPLQHGVKRVNPGSVKVTVDIEQSLSRTFAKVPIQIERLQNGEQVKLTGPQTIQVTVAGPKSAVSQLTANQLTVYLDASTLTDNSHSASVQVLAPEWIQVSQVSSGQVPVTVTGKPS